MYKSTKLSAASTASSDISGGMDSGVSMWKSTGMTAATLRTCPFDLLNIPVVLLDKDKQHKRVHESYVNMHVIMISETDKIIKDIMYM